MYNLFKFELYKLRHSKTFRNCLLIISGLIILNIVMYFNAPQQMYIMTDYLEGRNFGFVVNNFIDKLHPTSIEFCYSAAGFATIVEVLVMFLVGAIVIDEYTNGTIKNIAAHGHKRMYVYISKLLTLALGVLILSAFLIFGTTMVGTFINRERGLFSLNNILAMIKFVLVLWGILFSLASIYMCLAIIIRNKAVVVGLGTTLMFSTYFLMRPLYRALNRYPRYTPTYMLMDICSVPPSAAGLYSMLTTCSVLIIFTTIVGGYMFKRQDIK